MMRVLVFLILTFSVTWAAWLLPREIGGPVFYIGVFAPALVALTLTALENGADGVRRLLSGIGRWDVAARWWIFALTYTVALKLVAAALHRIFVGAWPAFGDTPWFLMAGAILISTWTQAGEEIGWRGYALPRMTQSLGLGGASVLLGVIWALWHLPLFFFPAASQGQPFIIYLIHVITVSVAMAWLYWKTNQSLLLVMVMHAAVNNTIGIVPAALPYPVELLSPHASFVAWATAGLSAVVAVLLLFRMRGAKL